MKFEYKSDRANWQSWCNLRVSVEIQISVAAVRMAVCLPKVERAEARSLKLNASLNSKEYTECDVRERQMRKDVFHTQFWRLQIKI